MPLMIDFVCILNIYIYKKKNPKPDLFYSHNFYIELKKVQLSFNLMQLHILMLLAALHLQKHI